MRQISSQLREYLGGPARTTCWLLRLVLRDGRVFGITTLDRDIEYAGGTFHAANGFDPSKIVTDSTMSVNNSQPRALLSADVPGITAEMVAAGELDEATWDVVLVNYEDLGMGHVVIGSGDVGQVNVVNGVIYLPELLDIMMRLRQPIGHFTSRMCRATFGTPANSMTGCGVDAEALWVAGEVTGVSAEEPFRVFADSAKPLDPFPDRARVQWLSGPNAGSRLYQVEAYGDVTGTLALIEPTPFPIEAGHAFRVRPDCDKSPDACTAYGNWLNYKGENLIPSGEGAAVLTPGAGIAGGVMGDVVE